MNRKWIEWYFYCLLNLLISLFPVWLSSLWFSCRPSSGWFCPHALCLHAQQPAVPSAHGTISSLPLYIQTSHFFIHTVCDTHHQVSTLHICWQVLLDGHVCCLLLTVKMRLTESWTVQLTDSAYRSAEAAVDHPALMNCSATPQLPSHHTNKL